MWWEKLGVMILPKIWAEGFKKVEKQDIVTKALRVCYKNKMMKKTWRPFIKSVVSFLEDGVDEAKTSLQWDND